MRPPDGGETLQLTNDSALEGDPTWSPDGDRPAFSSDRAGDLDIWTIDAVSGEPQRITEHEGPDLQPS